MEKNFKKLEKTIGVSFKNTDLLRSAMVHRSYLNEHKDFRLDHNERLEFLGDAVLELVVTAYLFANFSEAEGVLTNWRSSLVNGDHLAKRAEDINLYNYLYLSKGEAQDTNSKGRNYILANAYEALIGAIYLDQGYEVTRKFIEEKLVAHLQGIIEEKSYIDSKSNFQERAQEHLGVTPRYKVISDSGPDHNKVFVVGVYLDNELIAEGKGTSKQEAQTDAAHHALTIKKWDK